MRPWFNYLRYVVAGAIAVNLLTLLVELTITHPTDDAKTVVHAITSGRYANLFWVGTVLAGNLLPLAMVIFGGTWGLAASGILVLLGIWFTEKIWVEAPQRVPLT
jgi:hypothetical protein